MCVMYGGKYGVTFVEGRFYGGYEAKHTGKKATADCVRSIFCYTVVHVVNGPMYVENNE